jgi:hypothetical protein
MCKTVVALKIDLVFNLFPGNIPANDGNKVLITSCKAGTTQQMTIFRLRSMNTEKIIAMNLAIFMVFKKTRLFRYCSLDKIAFIYPLDDN